MALAHPIHPNSIFALELRESMEKGREEGMEKGMERGAYLNKLEIAKGMLRKNLSIDLISEITGFPTAELDELQRTN